MAHRVLSLAVGVMALGLSVSSAAQAADVQWFGQSAFKKALGDYSGEVIVMEPGEIRAF